MREAIKRYAEAGMGLLQPKRAEELARGLVKRGEAGRDQAAKIARELVGWSKRNAERVVGLVQREVKKQVSALGLATKDDLDSLKKRVRQLERGPSSKSTRRKTTAKRTPAKA